MRSRLLPLCALLAAGAIGAGAGADDVPPTPAQRAIAGLRETLKQRPEDPTLHFYLALYQARSGDAAACVASLRRVLDLGDGLLPAAGLGFEKVGADRAFQDVRGELAARLKWVADAPIAFTLPDRTLIPEGIAWDGVGKRFFVGSIGHRKIVQVDSQGGMTAFSRDGDRLDHVLGLVVDAPRQRLYAVSTTALTEAGQKEKRNRIVAYDLRSDRKAGEFDVPGAAQLNDVTVAPDGMLYATDSGGGTLWRIDPKAGRADVLGGEGALRSVNGIAVSADGKFLYAAHGTGIALVELHGGAMSRMPPPPRESIAAIDGLYLRGGLLIGIQNVTNPGRVIGLHLGPDGRSIRSLQVLQSHHHPGFDEPTTAALTEDACYVLATTQVARFNSQGGLDDLDTLKPPVVVRIPLPVAAGK